MIKRTLEQRIERLERVMNRKSVKTEGVIDSRDADNLRQISLSVTRAMNKFDDQMESAARHNAGLRDWPAYDDFCNAVLNLQQAVKDLLRVSADPSI